MYLDPQGLVHYAANVSDRGSATRYTVCERRGTAYTGWPDAHLAVVGPYRMPTCFPCIAAGDEWG